MKEEIVNKYWCEGVGKEGKICPLRETCQSFAEGFDKRRTYHFAWAPYNWNVSKCDEFQPIGTDDVVDKVNNFLNPYNN